MVRSASLEFPFMKSYSHVCGKVDRTIVVGDSSRARVAKMKVRGIGGRDRRLWRVFNNADKLWKYLGYKE